MPNLPKPSLGMLVLLLTASYVHAQVPAQATGRFPEPSRALQGQRSLTRKSPSKMSPAAINGDANQFGRDLHGREPRAGRLRGFDSGGRIQRQGSQRDAHTRRQTNAESALTVASSGGAASALGDLGFPADQAQGNAQDQARLDKGSQMLQMHQRYGLIATIPLAGTIIASGSASGKHSSATGRDIHGALGITTTGLYFTSAYYAIWAPRVPGTAVAGVTAIAYGAAILSVTIKF